MATTSKYTYKQFGLDIIALAKGELELTPEVSIRLMEKAQAATMEKANAIKSVLTASPMTAAEINAALGTDYTALQVANAVKYIEGVTSEKVVRTVTNSKGLTSQKEYTGYKVG